VTASDRILDAGCGWGGSSIWLAQRFGVRVHGINVDVEQVAKARRKAALFGVADKPRFSVQDFARTAFAPRTFDVVWAVESICYAADKRDFLRDAARVLVPGGRLVIAEYLRAQRNGDARGEAALRDWFDQWRMADLATADELRAALAAEGFEPRAK